MAVIKNQEYFFNTDSKIHKKIKSDCFFNYAVKEAKDGFHWIADLNSVLDYGCGIGMTLDLYLETTRNYQSTIYGVDVSEEAIKRIKARHKKDNYQFYKIQNNKISTITDNSIEGCYLIHVLHHAHGYEDIFKEIHKKLKSNGKFFLCDLSANNGIINLGRKIFIKLPKFVKKKFSDDLVVDGDIPEKYAVNIPEILKQLENVGFKIEKVGYGHLFAFIFSWLDKLFYISKIPFFERVFKSLVSTETALLKFVFFQKKAHLFYIKCIKIDYGNNL